jgi:translation initiation factor 2B subunit (eIF-2B alpha/beta/delta family)
MSSYDVLPHYAITSIIVESRPEDEGRRFLHNLDNYLSDYAASHIARQ